MGYWRMVLRRAVQATVNDTKLDTWAGAMLVLVGPVLVSGVLWLLLGYALPDSAVWVRMGAAAVPLLLVPIALVMRLAAVPAALHCAATERIAELEQRLADLESTRARNRATLMRFYSDAQPILQATLRSPFSQGEAGSGNRNLSEISPRGETTDPPPPPSQGISSTDGPRAGAHHHGAEIQGRVGLYRQRSGSFRQQY